MPIRPEAPASKFELVLEVVQPGPVLSQEAPADVECQVVTPVELAVGQDESTSSGLVPYRLLAHEKQEGQSYPSQEGMKDWVSRDHGELFGGLALGNNLWRRGSA